MTTPIHSPIPADGGDEKPRIKPDPKSSAWKGHQVKESEQESELVNPPSPPSGSESSNSPASVSSRARSGSDLTAEAREAAEATHDTAHTLVFHKGATAAAASPVAAKENRGQELLEELGKLHFTGTPTLVATTGRDRPYFDREWDAFAKSFMGPANKTPFLSLGSYMDTAQALLDSIIDKNPALQITPDTDADRKEAIKAIYPNLMMMALLLSNKTGNELAVWNVDVQHYLGQVENPSEPGIPVAIKLVPQLNKWERLLLAGLDFEIPRLSMQKSLESAACQAPLTTPNLPPQAAVGSFIIRKRREDSFTFSVKQDKDRTVHFPFVVNTSGQIEAHGKKFDEFNDFVLACGGSDYLLDTVIYQQLLREASCPVTDSFIFNKLDDLAMSEQSYFLSQDIHSNDFHLIDYQSGTRKVYSLHTTERGIEMYSDNNYITTVPNLAEVRWMLGVQGAGISAQKAMEAAVSNDPSPIDDILKQEFPGCFIIRKGTGDSFMLSVKQDWDNVVSIAFTLKPSGQIEVSGKIYDDFAEFTREHKGTYRYSR